MKLGQIILKIQKKIMCENLWIFVWNFWGQNGKWVLLAQTDICEYTKFHCSPSVDKIKLYGYFDCWRFLFYDKYYIYSQNVAEACQTFATLCKYKLYKLIFLFLVYMSS